MFALQVGARMKARNDEALMGAWFGEMFARTKRLKKLDHYLNPPTAADRRRGLLDMFRRVMAKGKD